jgi:hypothetical protein
MIELPQNLDIDDYGSYADWVELCVLLEPAGSVSAAKIADVVRDAGLIGVAKNDLPRGDENFRDADVFSDEDAAERFALDVLAQIRNRAYLWNNEYPLALIGDRVNRACDNWQDAVTFTSLLLADISRGYPAAGIDMDPRSGFPRLFEKIVEACGRGLFRGRAARFGVPREPGWPIPVRDRIQKLGEGLGLLAQDLEGKVEPTSGDRGLDIAVRLGCGDDGPGTLVFLVQCATGKHWREKRGEPSLADWQDVLLWNAPLVRVVAIPWRLKTTQEYAENYRHFDAVILDRPRLVYGRPDRFLEGDTRTALANWCRGQIQKLPTLA